MSGKVVKLLTSKKAMELTGYRSVNSLKQLHESEDVALTCYRLKGGSGQGGIQWAWSEKELKAFMKNEGSHGDTEKWLVD
mgnify:FL=1